MSDELKPCPFCGDEEPEIKGANGTYYVGCLACGASGPVADFDEDALGDDAVSVWNRRTTTPHSALRTRPNDR